MSLYNEYDEESDEDREDDLDDDGTPDLASANFGSDDVSVLIGFGDGSYMPEARYPVAEGPIAIQCADVKEDGALDLIIADFNSHEVSVLLGVGDGTFSAKPRFSVGLTPDDLSRHPPASAAPCSTGSRRDCCRSR